MKKIVFTLMSLVILALIANTTIAQSSYDAPYVGAEQIYKWSAVTTESYTYVINTDPTDPANDVVAPGTIYTVSTGSLDHPAPGGTLAAAATADLGLTWLAPSVGNTYYVWLVAASSDGCVNWRYVTVVPEVNQVDFILAALGLYAEDESIATLEGAAAANGGNACPTPALRDGAVYDSNNSPDDGDVYAYFRVSQGADNNDDTWTFAFGIVTDPASPSGTIEYYNGSAWVSYTAALTGIADDAVQLLRVMIPTPLATAANATLITGTISSASEETSGLGDSDGSNDEQNYTVNRVAAIGGFSGN